MGMCASPRQAVWSGMRRQRSARSRPGLAVFPPAGELTPEGRAALVGSALSQLQAALATGSAGGGGLPGAQSLDLGSLALLLSRASRLVAHPSLGPADRQRLDLGAVQVWHPPCYACRATSFAALLDVCT